MSGRAALMQSLLPLVCNCIGQTGFNVGHSVDLMLGARPSAKIISFQLRRKAGSEARRACTQGAAFIDNKYPGKHSLIYGNSQQTLVQFGREHGCIGSFFDVVLVDGGHSFKCAHADILHFRPLARQDAILIVDDVRGKPAHPWEKGPSRAWRTVVNVGLVVEDGCENGLAWGHYVRS
jgi:hypothetical protein